MKNAFLTMDVEDWYHLDYFRKDECDLNQTMLDGLDKYVELLDLHKIKSTFFVVGELVERLAPTLSKLAELGHEIAAHSHRHKRPMRMDLDDFAEDTKRCKQAIKEHLNIDPLGYRAPCFSLDRARLEVLRDLGFTYDSSKIDFGSHPLYENLDISGFEQLNTTVFKSEGFFEFEMNTFHLGSKRLPISGGGYLRIFPWILTRSLLTSHLRKNSNYVLYIHPFELSRSEPPKLPQNIGRLKRARFRIGQRSTPRKLASLITMLRKRGFQFRTFSDYIAGEK